MSITATTGLLSGIDYESIISATMEVEKQPIYDLQAKQSDYEAKISSYGSIKSAMSNLQDAVDALKDASNFVTYSASSSDTDILSVSTDDDAHTGTYSITVKNLAKNEIVNSYTGFTASDSAVGTGVITLGTGDATWKTITIDSSNNTLDGIAGAINDSECGVSATVIKLSSGAYALSLTADDTGESINFSISDDGDGSDSDESGLSRLYTDPSTGSMDVTQSAEKASFTFNGLDIERDSNTIDDLIEGVTIDLKDADEETTVTVSVKKKYTSMVSAINEFITAYNSMISVYDDVQSYDTDSGEAGTLFGDYSATMIKDGAAKLLRNSVDGISDDVSSLSALGIEVTEDGTLEFDSDTFDSVIEDNEDDVITFFTSDADGNEGFAVKLYDYLDSYTESGGVLESRIDSYQDSIDKIDDEIDAKQLLLDKREERLWAYYNALESKLSDLTSLQTAVESMISTFTS